MRYSESRSTVASGLIISARERPWEWNKGERNSNEKMTSLYETIWRCSVVVLLQFLILFLPLSIGSRRESANDWYVFGLKWEVIPGRRFFSSVWGEILYWPLTFCKRLIGSCLKWPSALPCVSAVFIQVHFKAWRFFIACCNPGECVVRWTLHKLVTSVLSTLSCCMVQCSQGWSCRVVVLCGFAD
jgi:hypothetical protein